MRVGAGLPYEMAGSCGLGRGWLCMNAVEEGKDGVSTGVRADPTARCGLEPPDRQVFLSPGCCAECEGVAA